MYLFMYNQIKCHSHSLKSHRGYVIISGINSRPPSSTFGRLIPLKSKITINLVDERTCQQLRFRETIKVGATCPFLFLKFDKKHCEFVAACCEPRNNHYNNYKLWRVISWSGDVTAYYHCPAYCYDLGAVPIVFGSNRGAHISTYAT